MFSIFQNTHLYNVFLVCGDLQDMFMMNDLQKRGFESFLNVHLKRELGYKRIVYYSGAKNLGKFVLDDESAILAINANKYSDGEASLPQGAAAKKKRIINPKSVNSSAQSAEAPPRPKDGSEGSAGKKKLIYKQPKITPVEFLSEARSMMNERDPEKKSAIVFVNIDDFTGDPSNPQQPYRELVSYLWGKWDREKNDNICIFLAPEKRPADILIKFREIQGGDNFINKFFNHDDSVNEDTLIEIGLPYMDEIGFLMDYYRIIGEGGGRIDFDEKGRRKLKSQIMFLSQEIAVKTRKRGYLRAIDEELKQIVKNSDGITNLDEKEAKRMFKSGIKTNDIAPLEVLRNTRGWEKIYSRVNAVLSDFERAKRKYEIEWGSVSKGEDFKWSNERFLRESSSGFRYKIPHFVLRGNPGVGKTTVAKLIGRIFFDAGILKRGHTVETSRGGLVAEHIGGSAIKTRACADSAKEGVLFLDDAYSLYDASTEHNYCKEAVDTLVQIMTDEKNNRFSLVIAGYSEQMDELLTMNKGWKDRFTDDNILTIEDYNPDILKEIFVKYCAKEGFDFDLKDASGEALSLDLFFENLHKQRDRSNFANARTAEAVATSVVQNANRRGDHIIKVEDFGERRNYFEKRDVDSVDEIYKELDKYVGFEFVKEIFQNAELRIRAQRDAEARGIQLKQLPDHYIFAGNPGTGKTTVGKLMGQFYNLLDVLGGRETLFRDASEILGTHYGDSAQRVTKVFQEAIDKNTTLFIDEAYQIIDAGYSQEIIGAMMTKMTENAADFKVIFGMYENRVDDFLKLNAGLSRRLEVAHFPDYNPAQLAEIFDRGVKRLGLDITDEAGGLVRKILKRKYDIRDETFGNAGIVEKLLEKMNLNRIGRTAGAGDFTNALELTDEDIPEADVMAIDALLNPKSLDEILEELNRLVGMDNIKELTRTKRDEIEFAKRTGRGMDKIIPGYYFFLGNPGTGKTTAARLFAQAMKELGVIRTDKFIECTAEDFIGQYVGETGKKTRRLLKSSKNATLFVDEAYGLASQDGGGDTFKKEAMTELTAFMDNAENRRECCIIFAGYKREMEEFFRSNSGILSRGAIIYFEDYASEQIYDIFESFCAKEGYPAASGVREIYVPIIERLSECQYFANARTARTIFEMTERKMKSRIVRSETDVKCEITEEDLLSYEELRKAISM